MMMILTAIMDNHKQKATVGLDNSDPGQCRMMILRWRPRSEQRPSGDWVLVLGNWHPQTFQAEPTLGHGGGKTCFPKTAKKYGSRVSRHFACKNLCPVCLDQNFFRTRVGGGRGVHPKHQHVTLSGENMFVMFSLPKKEGENRATQNT